MELLLVRVHLVCTRFGGFQHPFPEKVDEVPNFIACTINKECAAPKVTHTILLRMCNDFVNMNTTLINTLLSLIPAAFKLLYEQEWMMNPNAVFQQCFDWFVIKYGCTSAKDRGTNQRAMAADWHPLMGFDLLALCLFHGVTFKSLSGHLIMDKDTINIGMCILNCMGLFPKEYKTWILRGNDGAKTNDCISFKCFRRTQSKLLHLPPSLQASTGTAWPQQMTAHRLNLSWMQCQTLVWTMPPPKNCYD